jgi:hypothetical protein
LHADIEVTGLFAKAANIVHQIPDILVHDTGSAIESFHCEIRSTSVSNDGEYFTIRRSEVPGVIGEIAGRDFAGLFKYGGHFANAVTSRSMTFRAKPNIESLAGFQGFWSRSDRVFQ